MTKAAFLDRDGVVNRALVIGGKPFPPASVDDLDILEGVEHSLKLLKKNGYLIFIVTNQPDVARGKTSRTMVEEINNRLEETLPIDEIVVCFHDDTDNCECRKPLPGMLYALAGRHGVSLEESIMVGDRAKDMEAGNSAGCKTFFIDYSYAEQPPTRYDFRVGSLSEAVEIELRN